MRFLLKEECDNLGIPYAQGLRVYEDADVSALFPKRPRNTNKGDFGKACIVAGSHKYPGAAALSVATALKSGCGYCTLVTDQSVKAGLFASYPQAIYADAPDLAADCIAIGMGCGLSEELYKKITALLTSYCGKLIIDADGLNALSKYGLDVLKNKSCKVLLTPHVREFSRLSGLDEGSILADPVKVAKNFAKEYNVTVLLKNWYSVLTDGEECVVNLRGNSSLARAGSGDMLSGFICGNCARGLTLMQSAACSQYVLGMSAEIASERMTEYCVCAADLIEEIHNSLKRLTR